MVLTEQENITPIVEVSRKFEPKKQCSILLSESYYRLDLGSKASRVAGCGSVLDFTPSDEGFKLVHADFCHDRLCPMCSWRRSLKIFSQVSQIMDLIGNKYRYIFLTLTVPNCDPSVLSHTIDKMQKSFNKFIQYKRVKTVVKGFFRALEITRNHNNNTYHPHYHLVIAVNHSYFTSRDYLKRDEWLELWRKATKIPTITQVDVRTFKDKKTGSVSIENLSSAIAELAKYPFKSKDYIFEDDPELTDDIVWTLVNALHHRRLTSFGGAFDKARKQLDLDDCEDGDLIHVDGQLREDVSEMIYRYQWSCGCYKLVSVERHVNLVVECDDDD